MIQEGVLHVAYHLDSVRTEVVVVTGQLEARARNVCNADAALVDVSGIIDDLKIVGFYDLRQENA